MTLVTVAFFKTGVFLFGFIFISLSLSALLFPLVFTVRLTSAVSPSGGKANLISSLVCPGCG